MIQLDFRKNCLNRLSKILFRLGKTTYWKEWYSISADLFSFYARTIDMSIILEKDERFVKDEQIRRYIDKCFDDFHAKAQGLPPFSKQYSSQHNRIDSSYRDIKLCILAPRFVYNDKRYIECEFENYFVKTALEVGIQAEIFHTDLISYPNLIKDASDEEEKGALKAFSQARDVESRHAELYKKAMNDMLANRQTEYYVCQVCGYINEDKAPEKCPVCGAVPGKFKLVN